MKTEAGSRPDGWVVCSWCRFNISRETKWENNKLKAEPSCFICSYVKHRAVSPACTDLYTWEHLSSPELTAAGTASALTRTHSVSSNHWGGLVNDRAFLVRPHLPPDTDDWTSLLIHHVGFVIAVRRRWKGPNTTREQTCRCRFMLIKTRQNVWIWII